MKRALLVAALGIAGCSTVGPAVSPVAPLPVSSAASATIGFGAMAMLNGVRIRPLAVVEDSRCAINVRCVWAGRLVLAVEIDQRGGSETLRTNMTLGQPLATTDGTLILVDAGPPKIAGAGSVPPSQFTFELRR